MNNLIILLAFLLLLMILLWIMPTKKAKVVTECMTSLLQVFPVSKICNAIIAYYENKNKHIL